MDSFKNKLDRLKERYYRKNEKLKIKFSAQKNSHSLLWVWEFSKKAVLICFLFYVIVQVYSMTVMVMYQDFSNLGTLIDQAGQIVQNCVFAYFIKAGVENVGKIFWSNKIGQIEEEEDPDEEIVG